MGGTGYAWPEDDKCPMLAPPYAAILPPSRPPPRSCCSAAVSGLQLLRTPPIPNPVQLYPYLIGQGGRTRKRVEDDTGARITFPNRAQQQVGNAPPVCRAHILERPGLLTRTPQDFKAVVVDARPAALGSRPRQRTKQHRKPTGAESLGAMPAACLGPCILPCRAAGPAAVLWWCMAPAGLRWPVPAPSWSFWSASS